MKKSKPDVKAVLELADRFLNEYKEDIDNGVCHDEKQYQAGCRALANARGLLLAAPELLEAVKMALKFINESSYRFPKSIRHPLTFQMNLIRGSLNTTLSKVEPG